MEGRQLTSVLARRDTPPVHELTEHGFDPEVARLVADRVAGDVRPNILSDLPVSYDALGFAPVVRTLANIVLSNSTETPVTIAVDGEWGTGKTSILKMVEAQARLVGYNCIWLNAWSLESAENLIAAVAAEIQSEIKLRGSVNLKIQERLVESISDAVTSLAGGFSANLVESLAGVASGTLREVVRSKRTKKGIEQDVKEVASIASSHQSFKDLVDVMLGDSGHPGARIVVFIDDIDRALPDQIATILKNLKLILEVPRCVFMLAMDMDIVARAIENHYLRGSSAAPLTVNFGRELRESSVNIQSGASELVQTGFGSSYLEKMIQLRVRAPRLNRAVVEAYLSNLSIVEEALEIVRWAPDEEVLNPRRLKRYINWLSLAIQLMAASGVRGRLERAAVLKILALRRDYPRLHREVLNSEESGKIDWSTLFQGREAAVGEETVRALRSYVQDFNRSNLLEVERYLYENTALGGLDPAASTLPSGSSRESVSA